MQAWYLSQPLVTRTYMTGALLVSLLQRFRILNIQYLLFDPDYIKDSFQIWRFFTDYFVLGAMGFGIILKLFMIYFAFTRVEALFAGQQYADFIYLLAYLIVVIDILAWIFESLVLNNALTFALIYIWCKRKPFETISFYYGIKVQSQYFPWFLLGIGFLIGDDITKDLFGLAAGHIYIFLKDMLPVTHNKRYMETPTFFKSLVDKYIVPFTEYGKNLRMRQNNAPQRWQQFQGRGVQLG